MIRRLGHWILIISASLAVGSCCSAAKASKLVLISIDPLIHPSSTGPEIKPEKPTIHKGKKERLLWVSPPGSKLVNILITIPPGSKPPFQRCDVAGTTCKISCDAEGVCLSGRIHDEWVPPAPDVKDKYFYYEYTSAFVTGPAVDPGLIIKP